MSAARRFLIVVRRLLAYGKHPNEPCQHDLVTQPWNLLVATHP